MLAEGQHHSVTAGDGPWLDGLDQRRQRPLVSAEARERQSRGADGVRACRPGDSLLLLEERFRGIQITFERAQ